MTNADQEEIAALRREIERLNRRKRGPRWTVYLTTLPSQYREVWEQWLARYGLPSVKEIPANTELVFDSDTKTLAVTRRVTDDNGDAIRAGYEPLREKVTVVVEGVLQDFPPGFEVTVD